MEALDRENRQSRIFSIINHEAPNQGTTTQPYTSATMATIMSPAHSTSSPIYLNGPPPPYSSSWTPGPHSMAKLMSPTESQRPSDNKTGVPAPQNTRPALPSLPSIHEALNRGQKPSTYTSPLTTPSMTTPHQMSFPQPPAQSAPQTYPTLEQTHHSHHSQSRQPSPPRMMNHEPRPFSPPGSRPTSYMEAPRHSSFSNLPPSGSHNPYPTPRFDQPRNEAEYRSHERMPNGYSYNPPSTQSTYAFGMNAPSVLSPTYDSSRSSQQRPTMNDSWKASREPEKHDSSSVRAGIKRHLDTWDFENTLEEINVASSQLHEWSIHYNAIAQEQQRSKNSLPDRMPSVGSVNDMIMQNDKIRVALDKMRDIIPSQQRAPNQQAGERAGSEEGTDSYGLARSGSILDGPEKKRRGRAAPPGRCHSCNRAETPEWRRGPDGARTL